MVKENFKENLVMYCQHNIDLSKNNISTNYNAESCVSEKENTNEKHNRCEIELETKCTNWMFFLLNIFYLITALLVLAAGATGQFMYSSYGSIFEIKLVSVLWIVSGVALLFVSFFGIIGACKNSVAWINIYGLLITVAFAIQLSASVIGLTLIWESESIAKSTLDKFIYGYESLEPSSTSMDFIQKTFQCCGVQSPNDWGNYRKNDYSNLITPTHRIPQSCCTSGSADKNLTCDSYYQSGCLTKMSELTLQIIVTIFLIAIAIAVLQFIGIKISFVFAEMIRTMKSYEAYKVSLRTTHRTTLRW